MGLIKLVMDTAGGVISDQFLEYFYCDTIDNNTLMVLRYRLQEDRITRLPIILYPTDQK